MSPPAASPQMAASAGPAPSAEAAAPVPCLRLALARFLVAHERGLLVDHVAEELPALALSFDYGGTRVAARDRRAHVPAGRGPARPRDGAAETAARGLLERFGALDLSCLDGYEAATDQRVDYLVHGDRDAHAQVSFAAWAVPQLRALGWRVEIAPDFPYQVIAADAPIFAALEPDGDDEGWFDLELGIDVDGRRLSLLPAILDLIERGPATLAALRRMTRRFVAVEVAPGQFAAVPPDRLGRIVEILCELYDADRPRGSVRLEVDDARLAAGLADALGDGATVRDPAGLCARGRALDDAPPSVAPPRGLRATLRDYQVQGLAWMQKMRSLGAGGLLADDMGLGKTLQTIAHLAAEVESGRHSLPSLVVAPTSLVETWRREIAKFAPHLRVTTLHGARRAERYAALRQHDVVVTSYPVLLRDGARLGALPFYYVILDEAQTIKNRASQVSRAVKALDARHRLALSGTPVENHLGELWSLFDFLQPGMLGDEPGFRAAYRIPIEQGGNAERLAQLRDRLAPFILRRTKETVAPELPPKTEMILPVELGGAQRELYETIRVAAHGRVRKAIHEAGLGASTLPILDALMKLRQVCCDPRLVAVGAGRAVDGARGLDDERGSAKASAFFELTSGLVAQGRRVLVFSQFTSMLALLSRGLEARKIRHVVLTGATADRQAQVDAFQGGRAEVFLISLKAGGTGLTLTRADTVIHYDPWWNPAAQAQATDRAYRIGQTKPVFVYRLIAAGSVEERMLRLQQKKRELAQGLLGDAGGVSLTAGEVDELLAPLTDD